MPQCSNTIVVGARSSPLSIAQLEEVKRELKRFHPEISFVPFLVKTTGDHDKKSSLRMIGKTDFFTKEIDALLLEGKCRIAIHAAKDLPEPLPQGIACVAWTQGVDPSDVLIMRPGVTFETLPQGSCIATSSLRREENVRALRSDLTFVDIRGTIGERLAKLDSGEVDGVVMAEAALIRLGLTDRNRVQIPGGVAPLQGRLAILARSDDSEMKTLFHPLDYGL